jgi:hypothetical protein
MTEDNVVKFHPVEVGEGYRFDPNTILEEAKGHDFSSVVVIGELPDGKTWVSSAANAGEALVLMERAKRLIVFGEDTA